MFGKWQLMKSWFLVRMMIDNAATLCVSVWHYSNSPSLALCRIKSNWGKRWQGVYAYYKLATLLVIDAIDDNETSYHFCAYWERGILVSKMAY